MKKLLVISDTHGDITWLRSVYERHKHEVDACFHCGDSELSGDEPVLQNFHVVNGNTDIDQPFTNFLDTTVAGLSIWQTHGHLLHVTKSNLAPLHASAAEKGADVVIYGHTHVAEAHKHQDVIFLNPGSLLLPRGIVTPTYSMIHVEESQVQQIQFFDRNSGQPLKELEFTNA